jgi:23S rRNA (guanine745-N1)-methyltransferase
LAKEGYVNLLLANQKHSTDPGDSKLMINARRAFLEQDYYLPLARVVAELLVNNLESRQPSLHDAGCGEGYYLQKIVHYLALHNVQAKATGSDISKAAIAKAAKKYPALNFAVASSFKLPKSDESVDAIIQIFAPSRHVEIARLLKPHGLWLRVTPGASHLLELKQGLYDKAILHEAQSQVPEGFVQLESESLTFKLTLNDVKSRENLLMMTPFYWSAQASERPAILNNMSETTADFCIALLQKTP